MSDKQLIEAISKLYPKIGKAKITEFVKNKKKKSPITVASVTKVKVGVIPVKKRKKKKT